MKISATVFIIAIAALGISRVAVPGHNPDNVSNQPPGVNIKPNALKNMFGINAYEWNFLQDPHNLNDASHIYEPKMNLIKGFDNIAFMWS